MNKIVSPPPHNEISAELSSNQISNLNSFRFDIAKALAQSIGESAELRSIIKSSALEQIDGDYNVLLKDLLPFTIGKSKKFDELVNSYLLNINDFKKIVLDNPKIQISIPVHIEKWDIDVHSILVATFDFEKDEKQIESLTAFDKFGNKSSLDANTEPEIPVMILGLNERSDENGKIYDQFKHHSGVVLNSNLAKQNMVNSPLKYLLVTGVYLRDDHEPWYKGDPEIYSATRIIVNTPQRQGMYSVNDEWVWSNGTWYIWEDGVNSDTYVDHLNTTIDLAIYEEDFPAGPDDLVGNGFVEYNSHASLTWNNLTTSEQWYDSDTSHNGGCIVKIKQAN